MAEWVAAGLLLGAVAIAGCGFAGWCGLARRRREQAVDVCLVLLGLIQEVQLHRGLSGALLDRRREFRAELDANESKLERTLHDLAEQAGQRYPLFHSAAWHDLVEHWDSLRANWPALGFANNVTAHGEIVRGLIDMLRRFVEQQAPWLGQERRHLVSEWPLLIEELAMLRASGLHWLGGSDVDRATTDCAAVVAGLERSRRRLRRVAVAGGEEALMTRADRALRRIGWLLEGNAARYHPYTLLRGDDRRDRRLVRRPAPPAARHRRAPRDRTAPGDAAPA